MHDPNTTKINYVHLTADDFQTKLEMEQALHLSVEVT